MCFFFKLYYYTLSTDTDFFYAAFPFLFAAVSYLSLLHVGVDFFVTFFACICWMNLSSRICCLHTFCLFNSSSPFLTFSPHSATSFLTLLLRTYTSTKKITFSGFQGFYTWDEGDAERGHNKILQLQGDKSGCAKPPVDCKTKVPLWPGQAKTEPLFWSQREVLHNLMTSSGIGKSVTKPECYSIRRFSVQGRKSF